MHDFKPVAVLQSSLRPLLLVHNLAVEFNRHSVRFHAQFFDQSAQRLRRNAPLIAINDKIHRCFIFAVRKVRQQLIHLQE